MLNNQGHHWLDAGGALLTLPLGLPKNANDGTVAIALVDDFGEIINEETFIYRLLCLRIGSVGR